MKMQVSEEDFEAITRTLILGIHVASFLPMTFEDSIDKIDESTGGDIPKGAGLLSRRLEWTGGILRAAKWLNRVTERIYEERSDEE